jgi:hypothetical protein
MRRVFNLILVYFFILLITVLILVQLQQECYLQESSA